MTTTPFTIVAEPCAGGVQRVRLVGEFDMGVDSALASALVSAIETAQVRWVVADLSEATFLDSHGVAGLVEGYEAATRTGKRLTVIGASGLVRQVLDITGLSELLIEP